MPLGFRSFDPCGPAGVEGQVPGTCQSGLVKCKQEGRPEQVLCHFDLEHDWLDCCKCPLETTQGVELLCHRASRASTDAGLAPCTFQEGCQSQVTTSHFDLEHENELSFFVAGAQGGCDQTGAEDCSGSARVVQVCPIHRTRGFRPFPQCVRGAHSHVPRWAFTVRFRSLDPSGVHAPLPGAQVTEVVPGCSGRTAGLGRYVPDQAVAEVGADTGRHQLAEPQVIDGAGCDFLGGPLFSPVSSGTGLQQVEGDSNSPPFVSERRPWTWMIKCLLGVMQWTCVPSRVIAHCYLLATRVGEASNPGPDPGQGSNANTTGSPAFDIGNLLGPNFGTMLQNFIQQQIQSAVQAAVQEAMQKFQSSFQPHTKEERVPQEAPQPKRRRKGKGEGNSTSEAKPPANTQASADAKAKGKGKTNGKAEDPKANQHGTRGGDKPSPQKKNAGKGVGGKALTPPPQSKADSQDGWTKVERRRDDTKDAQFELRQQDWNAPLVSFSRLAKRLQETKEDEVCRGVILCPRKDVETARALFAGTPKKFAFLLIVLAKEYSEKPTGLQTQKVPGKFGNLLRAQDAYLQQAVSSGQQAPQPTGISSAPQKVATKATAVLFVKVPKAFAEAAVWKNFVEKPQRQIAQWTAARHVLCIDCFNWAEEQIQGGRRQVHGVIRVAQADVSTLLAYSGEQGIFLQQPRDQVKGQHVEWAERASKSESDADYLVRANRARGDLGLVCRDLSIGWRRPNDASTPVRKVWVLEHAPKTWDLQQVAGLLQEQFSDINMFRQIHRGEPHFPSCMQAWI